MRLEQQDACVICGSAGRTEHAAVPDRLFGVPGRWDIRRCVQCDSTWLNPRPAPEDLHLAYAHYYTHSETPDGDGASGQGRMRKLYGAAIQGLIASRFGGPRPPASMLERALSKALGLWAGRRADAEFFAFFLPVRPGGRLLDVGAGSGMAVARLRTLGWAAEGIDVDDAAVATAQAAGLPVHAGDLESQQFESETFDALTMSHVIEHVHDPRRLVAECLRVLRPGGSLAMVTPNANSWLHRRYGEFWLGLDPPRHLQLFVPETLKALTLDAGFVDASVTTTVRGANTIVAAHRGFVRDGSFDMSTRPPMVDRVWAEIVQEIEAILLTRRPAIGEDLVAIARKSG